MGLGRLIKERFGANPTAPEQNATNGRSSRRTPAQPEPNEGPFASLIPLHGQNPQIDGFYWDLKHHKSGK